MHATLERIDDAAANIQTFWFKPEKPFDYEPGQFTELHLPHNQADSRGEKRWFTISSSPTDTLFSITTKFAEDHSSTFKTALSGLSLGTRLYFAEPMGDFVLPKDKHLPLVFVAGSIGITPVHSMIKYLTDTNERRDITLLYDVHDQAEMVFTDLFTRYPLHFIPIVSNRPDGWTGKAGRVASSHILQTLKGTQAALIYLSGPEIMVETLTNELQQNGIPRHRLITDFFHGYRDV